LLLLTALETGASWELPGVDVRITPLPGGTMEVVETLHTNFGPHPRRGIDRQLPTVVVHPRVGPLPLEVHVHSVTRGGVEPVAYRVRPGPHFLAVEIGDPDSTRTGETIYQLRYSVRGALVEGMHRTSLRWPVVGGEWDASVFQVEAILELPTSGEASDVVAESRVGYFGDTGRSVDVQVAEPERVVYRLLRGLRPHEMLVIDAAWPSAPAAGTAGDAGSRRHRILLAAAGVAVVLALAIVARRLARQA
jgi:hypothetical protein